ITNQHANKSATSSNPPHPRLSDSVRLGASIKSVQRGGNTAQYGKFQAGRSRSARVRISPLDQTISAFDWTL
ncbi:hypothetical protein, partial [Mesorhizobium sp.]|uniref:hypothetical protein n=1 Tax=Mesorhizobium sp. TaxID=1871066 RepID=UPI0025FEEBE1